MPLLAQLVREAVGDDAMVLAAARGLVALAGPPALLLVAERATRSSDPLRAHLKALSPA